MFTIQKMRICATFSILIQFTNADLQVFGTCNTPDDESGVCIFLDDCPSLADVYQTYENADPEDTEFLRNSQCGFTNNKPLVCCNDQFKSLLPSTDCGYVARSENAERITRAAQKTGSKRKGSRHCVYIGEPVVHGEFPWTALLISCNCRNRLCPPKYICGGSLINNRYVVTAAHCIPDLGNYGIVRLAESNYNEANPHRKDFEIQKVISHYDYHPFTKHNDIALIRLAREVQFDGFIKPICVPQEIPELDEMLDENVELTAAGWGKTESGSQSPRLLKAKLPLVAQVTCKSKFQPGGMEIIDSQFCAGGNESDTCTGDSGGPIVAFVNTGRKCKIIGRFYLIGVASYGIDCGVQNLPAIYTKVTSYYEWIRSNIEL